MLFFLLAADFAASAFSAAAAAAADAGLAPIGIVSGAVGADDAVRMLEKTTSADDDDDVVVDVAVGVLELGSIPSPGLRPICSAKISNITAFWVSFSF